MVLISVKDNFTFPVALAKKSCNTSYSICQQILLTYSSKYIQNPITSYHLQCYILVLTTITFHLDHCNKPPDWSHWFTCVSCDPFSEVRVMLLNTSQIMSVFCTKLSNGSPSQNKAKVLQCPTDHIQSGLLRNLWSYLLVHPPFPPCSSYLVLLAVPWTSQMHSLSRTFALTVPLLGIHFCMTFFLTSLKSLFKYHFQWCLHWRTYLRLPLF